MVKSVGKISSVSLSTTDTGTPEFVNRICIHSVVNSRQGREGNNGVPSRERLVYPVSPVSLRGAESSTMPRSVRC